MSKLIVPGVAFMIASSPETFKLTRKVFGSWVGNFEGVATPAGLFLHMLFFLVVLFLVGKYLPMLFPRVSGMCMPCMLGCAKGKSCQNGCCQ